MTSQAPDLYHVGQVLSPWIIADPALRQRLRELLGPTRVGEALAELAKIVEREGCDGPEAATRWRPPWRFNPPRHPEPPQTRPREMTDADLELVARVGSRYLVPCDELRTWLLDLIKTTDLAPAVYRLREIEWAAAVPEYFAEPPTGLEALAAWSSAGELAAELIDRPDRHEAATGEDYAEPLVVHHLLDRGRQLPFREPLTWRDVATIAVTLAQSVMAGAGASWPRFGGLVALALAARANADRIVGETFSASQALAMSRPYYELETDSVMRWEYLWLVAGTLSHLRRSDEARRALGEAMSISRLMGDAHRMAKVLVLNSYLDFAASTLSRETLVQLNRAAQLVDPNRDSSLPAAIRLNLAWFQAELGLLDDAEATWQQIEPAQEAIFDARRQAILGLIHLKAERWDLARDLLSQAAGEMARHSHIDAPFFELHVALADLGAGRYREAARSSAAAVEYYQTVNVPEVAAAAARVRALAAAGSLTAKALSKLVEAIRAAPPPELQSRADQSIINPSD